LAKQVDTKPLPATVREKPAKNYAWYKQNIFTHWLAQTQQTFVIIFDPHKDIEKPLRHWLLDSFPATSACHPFETHTYLLQELVRFQDEAVWSIRDLVRGSETKRDSYRLKASYLYLHEVARHAIHVSETLSVAVSLLDTIMHEHDHFFLECPRTDAACSISRNQSRSQLSFIRTALNSLLERSKANKARLDNEIQLSFNILTLFNSKTSIKIGEAAQIDSATLKTIAFLTMTFLPATFVSGMFSMSFFGFSPDKDRWAISKQFWIYWAIAVPVTLLSLLVWQYWDRFFPMKPLDKDDE
jgi:Mg2+ and Co2+ transporter CorA